MVRSASAGLRPRDPQRLLNILPRICNVRQRRLGSFWRQCRSRSRAFAGVLAGNACQLGSVFSTQAMISAKLPRKGCCPTSSSYSTQPNAQMSARWSTSSPRTCSGLMYAGMPRINPACVIAVRVGAPARNSACDSGAALANPKSKTFTRPSGVTLMLAGLMSRCVIPL